MTNNTYTYCGYTIISADEGYMVLNPVDGNVIDVAMDMDEAREFILRH